MKNSLLNVKKKVKSNTGSTVFIGNSGLFCSVVTVCIIIQRHISQCLISSCG